MTENVALPLIEHAGLPRAQAEHLARSKLALAGLPPDAGDKSPASLSGGMVKRAALARALCGNPAVVLADEPTGNLDSENSREIIALFRHLQQKLGTTVIIATHDQEIAAQADRIITVKDGALV